MPGDFGLIGFDDVGHIAVKNQSSRTWHNAYGGGLYFVPYNMMIISAIIAVSKEEKLVNVSAGTRISITF